MKERELNTLEALARFKYLTAHQLARIFGVKSAGNMSVLFKGLEDRKKPLVGHREFGIDPQKGRLSRIHFLTAYGRDFVRDELDYADESIKFAKNAHSVFKRDYYHRQYTVDFNIAFQKWLGSQGHQFGFLDYYFDKSGSNRNGTGVALNAIQVNDFQIIPDAIGQFYTEERPYLFLFEQHNGADKMRAVKQIGAHCLAIAEGSASDKYRINSAARVYYVFEFESCKRAVMNELKNDPHFENFNQYFLFKTMDSLTNNFYSGWQHFNGEITTFI
jgi:hypothetical protein